VRVRDASDALGVAGLFGYNISILDSTGQVQDSMPLLLRVTAPGVHLAPASLQGQVAPAAVSASMAAGLQLTATLTAHSGQHTAVYLHIPAAAQCWLALTAPDASVRAMQADALPAPLQAALANSRLNRSGDALYSGTVLQNRALQLQLAVDLAQLPAGLHSTTVTVLVGDIALSSLSLPVSVLVASVIPCPQRVQLPPMMPRVTQGVDIRDSGALVLRNVAALAPHRIVGVAVLPGHSQDSVTPTGTVCSSNEPKHPSSKYSVDAQHQGCKCHCWRSGNSTTTTVIMNSSRFDASGYENG
jgi:hypothetical protein